MKEQAKKLYDGVNYLAAQITEKVDNCDVLGVPIGCGVAFKFKGNLADYDYAIAEALSEVGGWEIVRLQFPSGLFFQAGHGWIDEVDKLIIDINKAVKLVLNDHSKYNTSGMAGVYGTAASFPDRGIIADTCSIYLDTIHSPQW